MSVNGARVAYPDPVKPRRGAAALCCAVLLGGLAGCAGDAQPPVAEAPAPPTPAGLAAKVTMDGMKKHLQALADIATANKGNRADGTPGFTASVDYVVKTLRDRGFTVDTPEVSRLNILDPGQPAVTVAGRVFQVDQASQLLPTPAGDVNATVVQPVKPAGCAAADYRPNHLTNYLFELANRYSTFFEQCPVLKAPDEATRASRLALCDLTARTIRQGLELLGIGVVEQM